MKRDNGSILGPYNSTTNDTAAGMWSLNEARYLTAAQKFPTYGQYPVYSLAFNTLTSIPANVSFTRASAGSYVNSSGTITIAPTNTARFDYNPSSLVNRGILNEETRTNILNFSEIFNSTNFRIGTTSATANNATAPDGTTTASLWNANGSSADFDIYPNDYGSSPGNLQIFSLFVKPVSGVTYFYINIGGATPASFTLTGAGSVNSYGSFPFSSIQAYANGWYRISSAAVKGNVYHYWQAGMGASSGSTTVGQVYIWGLQLENVQYGSIIPSSYIRTGATSNTRANDVCTMVASNTSNWLDTTRGTILVQFDVFGKQNNQTALCIDNTSTSNTIKCIVANSQGDTATTNLYYEVTSSGSLQASIPSTGPLITTNTYKMGLALNTNDFAASRNGSSIIVDSVGFTPTANTIKFGRDYNNNNYMNGHIAVFSYYNLRLSNEKLVVATT